MRRRVQVVIAGAAVAVLAIVAVAVLTFPRPVGRGTAQSIGLPQELEQIVFRMAAPGLPVRADPGPTPGGVLGVRMGVFFAVGAVVMGMFVFCRNVSAIIMPSVAVRRSLLGTFGVV